MTGFVGLRSWKNGRVWKDRRCFGSGGGGGVTGGTFPVRRRVRERVEEWESRALIGRAMHPYEHSTRFEWMAHTITALWPLMTGVLTHRDLHCPTKMEAHLAVHKASGPTGFFAFFFELVALIPLPSRSTSLF